MNTIVILLCLFAGFPDALPDSLPDSTPAAIETPAVPPLAPRADEPAPAQDPPRILRWERRCGPNGCVMVPVYEESVDQAAAKLQDWRDLPEVEAQRLAAIVDAPEVRKARAGHWDAGTCAMLCTIPSHGTHWTWDDPIDDGTPEPAWGSWGTNQQGRMRIFGRRR